MSNFLLKFFILLKKILNLFCLEFDFISILLILDHNHSLLLLICKPSKIPVCVLNKFQFIIVYLRGYIVMVRYC